jgi:hypothetical protein
MDLTVVVQALVQVPGLRFFVLGRLDFAFAINPVRGSAKSLCAGPPRPFLRARPPARVAACQSPITRSRAVTSHTPATRPPEMT